MYDDDDRGAKHLKCWRKGQSERIEGIRGLNKCVYKRRGAEGARAVF